VIVAPDVSEEMADYDVRCPVCRRRTSVVEVRSDPGIPSSGQSERHAFRRVGVGLCPDHGEFESGALVARGS